MLDTLSQPSFLLPAILTLFLGEGILCFFVIRLSQKVSALIEKQNTLFRGKKAIDLESILLQQANDMRDMDKEIQELFEISNVLHRLALKSIHKVGVVRFNPFKEVGSNQSFAIALLDGKNSGTIISSIHTREGSRVYAKPIKNSRSEEFPLTEEEQEAILLAQKTPSIKKKP